MHPFLLFLLVLGLSIEGIWGTGRVGWVAITELNGDKKKESSNNLY